MQLFYLWPFQASDAGLGSATSGGGAPQGMAQVAAALKPLITQDAVAKATYQALLNLPPSVPPQYQSGEASARGCGEAVAGFLGRLALCQAATMNPHPYSHAPPGAALNSGQEELDGLAPLQDPDLLPAPSQCPVMLCKARPEAALWRWWRGWVRLQARAAPCTHHSPRPPPASCPHPWQTRGPVVAACLIFGQGGLHSQLPGLPKARLHAASGADAVVANCIPSTAEMASSVR